MHGGGIVGEDKRGFMEINKLTGKRTESIHDIFETTTCRSIGFAKQETIIRKKKTWNSRGLSANTNSNT